MKLYVLSHYQDRRRFVILDCGSVSKDFYYRTLPKISVLWYTTTDTQLTGNHRLMLSLTNNRYLNI